MNLPAGKRGWEDKSAGDRNFMPVVLGMAGVMLAHDAFNTAARG